MFQRKIGICYNKDKKCIFIGYKDGIKGYKLWNPITKNTIYIQDVVFREVKVVSKQEIQPRLEEPKTIEFELEGVESDSTEKDEPEDKEPQTPTLRRSIRKIRQTERYAPLDFYSSFVLFIIDGDPKTVREVVDSEDSKLWKKAMVEEMDALHKNEDLVELLARRKPIGSKWVFTKKLIA